MKNKLLAVITFVETICSSSALADAITESDIISGAVGTTVPSIENSNSAMAAADLILWLVFIAGLIGIVIALCISGSNNKH